MCILFNNFYFNGHEYSIVNFVPITLSDLVDYFGYKSILFVIEHNGYICNQNEWSKTVIKKNDRIELITIVGGG